MAKAKKSEKQEQALAARRVFIEKLSLRIKTLRIEQGYSSAEQFALHAGVSRVSMGYYETGKFNDIELGQLLKIAAGFDMTIQELLSEGFD